MRVQMSLATAVFATRLSPALLSQAEVLFEEDPVSFQVAVQKYFRLMYLPSSSQTRLLMTMVQKNETPEDMLHMHSGDLDAAKIILDIGAKNLDAMLDYAVETYEPPLVKLLLEYKANPNTKGYGGNSLLEIAYTQWEEVDEPCPIVDLLKEYGAGESHVSVDMLLPSCIREEEE